MSSGSRNMTMGWYSGRQIRDGSDNVMIGYYSGQYATGSRNIFMGYQSGMGGTTSAPYSSGTNNVGIGHQTLEAFTTGTDNVGVGPWSLQSITTGTSNVGVGRSALDSTTTKHYNTAIGHHAMKGANNTQQSVAIGSFVLDNLGGSAAEGFVCIGHLAGSGISGNGANACVAIGHSALITNANGGGNVAIGQSAGYLVTSDDNTLIGDLAGNAIGSGGENTILGANCDVASADNNNNVIIGNNLTATDKDNAVFIGNDSSHIENDFNADATWNHSSDVRQKIQIKDDTLGLSFINDIRPVTYKHKSPSEFPKEWKAYDPDDTDPMGGDKVIHGLIAQEVKEALDKQNIDTFGGWSEDDDGRQRVSFESFVMPLIKSVQELSSENKELKDELNELKIFIKKKLGEDDGY
jgi:hypothetical protein